MIELPGYKIIRELGRGGMARVYLALHQSLNRQVAIKVMLPALSVDTSFSDRFLREARIVAQLTHQNIITVYDVGVHKNHHYIAMEYLPGDSLDDKIKSSMNQQEILYIIKQIALGLNYAHEKGFIHRDIKPENILFKEDGVPVITDFGIARAEQSETKMTEVGTVIGTPHYMSPEQGQGFELTTATDIYSLGIVFYEMLVGEVPYRADSTMATIYKHVNDPIPVLKESLKVFQPMLNKLLAKKTQDRYLIAKQIVTDIEDIELGKGPTIALCNYPVDESTVFSRPAPSSGGLAWGSNIAKYLLISLGIIIFIGLGGYFLIYVPYMNNQLVNEKLLKEKNKISVQDKENIDKVNIDNKKELALYREREGFRKQRLEAENKAKEIKILDSRKKEKQLVFNRNKKEEMEREQEKLIKELIVKSEKYFVKNRLKDASDSFQKILGLDFNNKTAKKGIYKVAQRYLYLAETAAADLGFEKANLYINHAISIAPTHKNLAATQKKVFELRDKQFKIQEEHNKGIVLQQESENKMTEEKESKKTNTRRSFGGF